MYIAMPNIIAASKNDGKRAMSWLKTKQWELAKNRIARTTTAIYKGQAYAEVCGAWIKFSRTCKITMPSA